MKTSNTFDLLLVNIGVALSSHYFITSNNIALKQYFIYVQLIMLVLTIVSYSIEKYKKL